MIYPGEQNEADQGNLEEHGDVEPLNLNQQVEQQTKRTL